MMNSIGVWVDTHMSKVSVRDTAVVKQVEQ